MFPTLFDQYDLWATSSSAKTNHETVNEIINNIVFILSPSQKQQSVEQQQQYDAYSNSIKVIHLQYLQENCILLFKNNIPLFYDLYDKLMGIVTQLEPLNSFIDGHVRIVIYSK